MRQSHPDVDLFIDNLAALSFPDVFNPYVHISAESDRSNAAEIRRDNLRAVLNAALTVRVESLWVARDLGYRGGRRTGLAMTDDPHLAAHAQMFGIDALIRPTVGPPVVERTAGIIWRVLADIGQPIFLWNVFPLHPHGPGDEMSNRLHNRVEREAARPLLAWLLGALRPERVVAIGRDAQQALLTLGVSNNIEQVRHPSYGGQREFEESAYALYGATRKSESTLFDAP